MLAGGVLACHGKGCNITLSDVKFNGCALVATAGATVSLTSCSFTRDKGGVSAVASGQGTTVFMRDVTLRGGELGVAAMQEGSLKASQLHLKRVTSGVDVSDKLSTVELDDCVFGDISSGSLQESVAPDSTACIHKGEGVAVRNSSTAILKNVAISNVHRGVMVASDATATLSGCTVGRSDRCVWVSTHGTCDLQDCTLAGALVGVSVHGASSVEARGCRIQRHMTAGVKVVKDGRCGHHIACCTCMCAAPALIWTVTIRQDPQQRQYQVDTSFSSRCRGRCTAHSHRCAMVSELIIIVQHR